MDTCSVRMLTIEVGGQTTCMRNVGPFETATFATTTNGAVYCLLCSAASRPWNCTPHRHGRFRSSPRLCEPFPAHIAAPHPENPPCPAQEGAFRSTAHASHAYRASTASDTTGTLPPCCYCFNHWITVAAAVSPVVLLFVLKTRPLVRSNNIYEP